MNNKFKFGMSIDAQKISSPFLLESVGLGSVWCVEHWRRGKLIDYTEHPNLMVDEGITYGMDSAFSGGTPITSWYIALFEDDHSPAAGQTYAVPVFTETTAYDEATRPQWSEAGVAAKVLTNSASKATFTFNATKTIYGGGLVGGGTDADTIDDQAGGGTLICNSQFTGGSKGVVDTDVLKITIAMTGSNV
jgi:hypothetical protein